MTHNQQYQMTEPLFITEEMEAEMKAAGYVFEPPPIVCTIRLRDVLKNMSDAELALQPGEMAEQKRARRWESVRIADGG